MSIIAAGTTTTTALSSTGNTDGTLQLQVNGTTPSVTLNTLGAVGVGASPSFGTSGQALLSAGSTAAPAWGNVQAPLVSGTTIKTVNSASLLGSGDVAVQPTLVSGTNIKTINGGSVLGSGDLAVGGGSWIFLSSVTASNSATVSFTGLTSTYDAYAVTITNANPSEASVVLQIRFSNNNGSSYISSGYGFAIVMGVGSAASAASGSSASQSNLNSTAWLMDTNTRASGVVNLFGLLNAATFPNGMSQMSYGNGAGQRIAVASFSNETAQAINAFQFFMSSGNIASGIFSLYGIKKS